MELRHLRYFLAVAEERHFTRAATRLGISQPPLSQQIRHLEQDLGVTLFRRLPQGVVLTAAGERFVEDAQAILRQVEQSVGNARRAARGELGTIRIGFTSSASFHPFVTGAIRDYRGRFPDIAVELVEETTSRLLDRLVAQTVDTAFIRPSPGECGPLRAMKLFDETMLVVLPSSHRLAGQQAVRLADLAGENFILYPRRNGRAMYDAIVTACQASGFSPRVGQEAPQMASTVTLVATGIGVSIVPASMGQVRAPGISYRPIKGAAPAASMSLVSASLHDPTVPNGFVALVASKLAADSRMA
jgi:DNA-binding transcriptional LysR family regulator